MPGVDDGIAGASHAAFLHARRMSDAGSDGTEDSAACCTHLTMGDRVREPGEVTIHVVREPLLATASFDATYCPVSPFLTLRDVVEMASVSRANFDAIHGDPVDRRFIRVWLHVEAHRRQLEAFNTEHRVQFAELDRTCDTLLLRKEHELAWRPSLAGIQKAGEAAVSTSGFTWMCLHLAGDITNGRYLRELQRPLMAVSVLSAATVSGLSWVQAVFDRHDRETREAEGATRDVRWAQAMAGRARARVQKWEHCFDRFRAAARKAQAEKLNPQPASA